MLVLTEAQLLAFLPALAGASAWVQALNAAWARFEITTGARGAAFLAQVAHESGEFRRLEENLSYTAKRLTQVWPSRFPTLKSARPFERQPERLANFVYAKRLGNGDRVSGDGWRYHGRGLIQLTGRGNYRACGLAIALPLETEPDLLLQRDVAALSAAQFWQSRGLNELADDRSDDDDQEDFVRITTIINGGKQGLASRLDLWERAKLALA